MACQRTLALINANVKTMNPNQPTAQAVAIKENKIIKVGSNQEIKQLIGENTQSSGPRRQNSGARIN